MAAAPAVPPAARRALNANLGTITNLPSRAIPKVDSNTKTLSKLDSKLNAFFKADKPNM